MNVRACDPLHIFSLSVVRAKIGQGTFRCDLCIFENMTELTFEIIAQVKNVFLDTLGLGLTFFGGDSLKR
jgi:hypothetical protein